MSGVEGRRPHPSGDDLLAWHDGELHAARRNEVRDHLAGCAECRRELQSLRDDLAWASEKLAVLDVDPGPLQRSATPGRGASGHGLRRPLTAAVALVLIVGGSLVALAPEGLLPTWLGVAPVEDPLADGPAPRDLWTERLATPAPRTLTLVIEGPGPTEIEFVRTRDDVLVILTPAHSPPGRLELGGDRLVVDPGDARRIRILVPITSSARVLHQGETALELPSVARPDSSTILTVGEGAGGMPR